MKDVFREYEDQLDPKNGKFVFVCYFVETFQKHIFHRLLSESIRGHFMH